jgi:hypothetical protein
MKTLIALAVMLLIATNAFAGMACAADANGKMNCALITVTYHRT